MSVEALLLATVSMVASMAAVAFCIVMLVFCGAAFILM